MFAFNHELMKYAKDNYIDVKEDYKKAYNEVGLSGAVYKGKQLPFLYYPAVYSLEDIRVFEELKESIYGIVNKSIDIYLQNPEVRYIWNFDKRLEELILIPSLYKAHVPMGRFDFFYYENGEYMFCELNTDGSSAMNEETPLTNVLLNTIGMKEFSKKHEVFRYELYHSWVREVGKIYGEYVANGGELKEKPYVAILDFFEGEPPLEFQIFKKAFTEHGYLCDIINPLNLMEKNGKLYFEENEIDIIYRRLVTRDMMENYDELGALIAGLKSNKTCIIGNIKSQIVHTKKYFEALHHPSFRKYFNKSELEYIDKHIPFTKKLDLDDDLSYYVKQKDEFIIKPIDYYASKGVYAGKEFSEAKWQKMLTEASEKGYIIQSFCPKSESENLSFDRDGDFKIMTFNHITGIFVYNESLSGVFTRAGLNAVISDLNDGFSLSSVVAKEKSED